MVDTQLVEKCCAMPSRPLLASLRISPGLLRLVCTAPWLATSTLHYRHNKNFRPRPACHPKVSFGGFRQIKVSQVVRCFLSVILQLSVNLPFELYTRVARKHPSKLVPWIHLHTPKKLSQTFDPRPCLPKLSGLTWTFGPVRRKFFVVLAASAEPKGPDVPVDIFKAAVGQPVLSMHARASR